MSVFHPDAQASSLEGEILGPLSGGGVESRPGWVRQQLHRLKEWLMEPLPFPRDHWYADEWRYEDCLGQEKR